MLTGTQVRVRIARNRIIPHYLDIAAPEWQAAGGQLIELFREMVGRTRGERDGELEQIAAAGAEQLIWQGLAKLLDDRCEYEVSSEHPPEELREFAFRLAAKQRVKPHSFDRQAILQEIAVERQMTAEQVDIGLFADLKNEQKCQSFDVCSVDYLLKRYNAALAQAMLIRSVNLEAVVWGETQPRYRQLFRAAKFHKLIGRIESGPNDSYRLTFDGPLSLFSATQKYGLQLALFLPSLMHCKNYELKSTVIWGAKRAEKLFTLTAADGIASHTPDFGQYRPVELEAFATTFRDKSDKWTLDAEPSPVPLGDEIWVPDFRLTHKRTKRVVDLEVIGYWRKPSVVRQLDLLRRHRPKQFLLLVGEQYKADEEAEFAFGEGVVRYKRTPSVAEVLKALDE